MKNIITLTVMIIAALGPSFSQKLQNEFLLNGKLAGQDEGLMYLYYSDSENKSIKDSAALKNGTFSFKGNINAPSMGHLLLKEDKRNELNSTGFFLEPSVMDMSIKFNDFRNAVVKGSATQKEYSVLTDAKKSVEAKYKKQLDSLRTEKDHERNAEVRERLAPYFREMDEKDYAFFDKNPQSYVTAYMLRFHVGDLSLDSIQMFYDRLGSTLQQTTYARNISEEIDKLRGGSPGSTAKDFTATDINGKPLSLSDYKGRYVLIDFWASWCVPCRKGNPNLKELYAKYKDKGIEFIGIADDDRTEEAWRKAVDKDGIGIWKHIRRGLKYQNGSYDRSTDISEKFGIHSLPTKILIDPNGIIIGRYGEEESTLYKKLEGIFGG